VEIVPESDELQIEAQLPPQEVDHVRNGQRAYIRFSAFNQHHVAARRGCVLRLGRSQSRSAEKQECRNLLHGTRALPPSERRRLGGLELVSGMPVEVFLQTGSQTMMSYLLKPITDQLLRTFN
jgi:HlyD family secretion protein